jgi:uncharacterized protein YyaL (SSP411 family)
VSRPNHLRGQTSPYLLQHLYNPVDWYPWGPEALDRARAEDRPIFLSIGYAACHWCHVIERESFENDEIAEFLNRHFVAIKVDREERPDIDEIYMNAVQLLTGAGGWPLSAFLTPDREPFYAGTYFPPRDRHGQPGFLSLLRGIRHAWDESRDDVLRSAGQLTEKLGLIARGAGGEAEGRTVDQHHQMLAVADLARRFEPPWGGFGGAPKFPPDGAIALLLREHARSGEKTPLGMAERTLDAMALGGMYDQVGGGFARYSVDERWLVPHFEKMLYNQALLVPLYVDAWKLLRKPLYRDVVEQTLDFVRREMTDAEGGFHSSLDADSEGEEGRFYVWTPLEVREVLGTEEGDLFCEVYSITDAGNFEGRNIANLLGGPLEEQARERGLDPGELRDRMRAARAGLLDARERRARPGTDDKVLTAWNGLMISAFAVAYQLFGRDEDLRSARGAADFVLSRLMDGDRLRVSYRAGEIRLNAYLDDYAFLARALIDLYEACFDPDYLWTAQRLARSIVEHFEDRETGGFFFVSDDHEALLTRNRSQHDGALPSGAGVAVEAMARLALHLDDDPFRAVADKALEAYGPTVARSPSAFASMLVAADFARGPVVELAIAGPPEHPLTREMLAVVHAEYHPRLALAVGAPGAAGRELALLAGKPVRDGRPTAYVCRDYACRSPVTDPQALARQLREV